MGSLSGVFNMKSGLQIWFKYKIWFKHNNPSLLAKHLTKKTHPGKKRVQIVFFCVFFGNKKDARRPYDHFGGGIAPRSLLCVRKRRFPFLKPRCFCAAKMLFWGNRTAGAGGTGGPLRGNRPPAQHQPIFFPTLHRRAPISTRTPTDSLKKQ